ncbi:hypothetical protein DE146DRAFT_474627 [Phaeosphaeria sp. MPI-PUGE-AT-0046c]|nr:hypothetical protein DE146DRAFT_474627 [Phaeosphaeria sp. MPI-PUGE-AT-0046c]
MPTWQFHTDFMTSHFISNSGSTRAVILQAFVSLKSLTYTFYRKMSKDSSFRLCIAALLIIQIACWMLALVDLFVPGKPRLIIRTTMDVVSQLFARRSSAMLLYRDFRASLY